jgi:Fe2+ transport system protein FeoA
VNGGHRLKHRLEEINLKLNTTFLVLENPDEGPIQIKVGEKEFPIGRGMARKILAQPIDGAKA